MEERTIESLNRTFMELKYVKESVKVAGQLS